MTDPSEVWPNSGNPVLSVTLQNTGIAPTLEYAIFRVAYSRDAIPSSDDIRMTTLSVAPMEIGAFGSITTQLGMGDTWPVGSGYLLVKLDEYNQMPEIDEVTGHVVAIPINLLAGPPADCVFSDWSCGTWEACQSNSLQVRACTLSNNNCANSEAVRPSELRSCVYVPLCQASDWNCNANGGWNTCAQDSSSSLGGSQSRVCQAPTNGCANAETVHPPETQECAWSAPVVDAGTPAQPLPLNAFTDSQGRWVYQPGPADGQDLWINSYYHLQIDNDYLQIGGWGDYYYSLLKFDLNGLPPVAAEVVIEVYNERTSGGLTPMTFHQLNSSWPTNGDNQNYSWNSQPSQTLLQSLPQPGYGEWIQIPITDLYNAWQSGATPNHGVEFRPTLNWNQYVRLTSSNNTADPSLRPKLVITPVAPSNPGGVDAGVSDTGASQGSVDAGVPAQPLPPNAEYDPQGRIVLQPGPVDGKDKTLSSSYGELDYPIFRAGGWGDWYHLLLEFDLTGLPAQASYVEIVLSDADNCSNCATTLLNLSRVTEAWQEPATPGVWSRNTNDWANRPSVVRLQSGLPGVNNIHGEAYRINITDLYNAWKRGDYPNFGIELSPVLNNNRYAEFMSSDEMIFPQFRPKLVITQ